MPSLNRFFGQCLLCITVACGGCASSSGGRAGTNQASGATKAAGFDSSMKAKIRATDKIVKRAANEYRLDPDLLRGMIWVESRFDPKATSPADAKGLMQLMPMGRLQALREAAVGVEEPDLEQLLKTLRAFACEEQCILSFVQDDADAGSFTRRCSLSGNLLRTLQKKRICEADPTAFNWSIAQGMIHIRR